MRITRRSLVRITCRTLCNFASQVKFSPDGKHLLIISGKNGFLWSVESGRIISFTEHQINIRDATFSKTGNLIVTVDNSAAYIWDFTGRQVRIIEPQNNRDQFCPSDSDTNTPNNYYSCIDFSPDGKQIAVLASNNSVQLRDLRNAEATNLQRHQEPINSINFSPNGEYVVTASQDQTVVLWKLFDGKIADEETVVLRGHQNSINTARFSPNGEYIVTASEDKTARIWDREGRENIFISRPDRNW